jgi:hypothetical protein
MYVDDNKNKKDGYRANWTTYIHILGTGALPGPPHGEMRTGGSIRATTWGEGGRNSQLRAVQA